MSRILIALAIAAAAVALVVLGGAAGVVTIVAIVLGATLFSRWDANAAGVVCTACSSRCSCA
jgi:hypothetical protein